MARTIFIYGVISGVRTLMLVGAGIAVLNVDQGVKGMIWGFSSMIVGLSGATAWRAGR